MSGDRIENADGTVTLALAYPVNDLHEATVRRPKVKDIKSMEAGKTDMEKSILLVCALTNLTRPQVEALDVVDFKCISEEADRFMGGNSAGLSS